MEKGTKIGLIISGILVVSVAGVLIYKKITKQKKLAGGVSVSEIISCYPKSEQDEAAKSIAKLNETELNAFSLLIVEYAGNTLTELAEEIKARYSIIVPSQIMC